MSEVPDFFGSLVTFSPWRHGFDSRRDHQDLRDSVSAGLGVCRKLTRGRADRLPRLVVLEHDENRALPDFLRERALASHRSILATNGASGKAGAIQTARGRHLGLCRPQNRHVFKPLGLVQFEARQCCLRPVQEGTASAGGDGTRKTRLIRQGMMPELLACRMYRA